MSAVDDLLSDLEGASSSGNPVDDLLLELEGPKESLPKKALNVASEAASAINRGVTNTADFLTTDQVNAVLSLAGSDKRVPSITELLSSATQGGQMQPGLAQDVVRSAGEMAAPGMAVGATIRQASKFLPQMAPGESAFTGIVRSLGKSTSQASDAALAATSGAGGAVGEEFGGEVGGVIGSMVAPVGLLKLNDMAIRSGKFFNKLLDKSPIDFNKRFEGADIRLLDDSGLPTEEFQASLNRYGMDIGDVTESMGTLPANIKANSVDDFIDEVVRNQLEQGARNGALASIKLGDMPAFSGQRGAVGPRGQRGGGGGKRKIIKDELGIEAQKQGFKAGDVAALKGANEQTRMEALDMLNKHRAIFKDSRKADEFRPSDVVGKWLQKTYKHIRTEADNYRSQLNLVAGERLKNKSINNDSVKNHVIDELSKLDIAVPDDMATDFKTLKAYLNTDKAYAGSIIKDDPTSRQMVKKTLSILEDNSSGNAAMAHKQKRRIDTYVNFKKSRTPQGYAGRGEDFAKSIRKNINDEIRDIDSEYAFVNDELSMSIQAMDDFQAAMGRKIDLTADNADQAIGQEMRKLLSQYKVRQQLQNSVNQLEDTARRLGYDSPVDVKELNRFATVLDNRFGSVADTSFQNKITAAMKLAQGTQGKTSLDLAADLVELGVKKTQNINDPQAYNTMQQLLRRGK